MSREPKADRRTRFGVLLVPLLVLAAVLPIGLTVVAQQAGEPAGQEVLEALSGKDLALTGDPQPVTDGVADATNRAGEPDEMAEGTDVVEADWHEVDSPLVASAVSDFCANQMELAGRSVEAVCPEDLTAIETAARFIYVEARTSGTFDPATVSQFVFLWAEPGLPTYQGSSGDPNTNQTDSIDLYRTSPADPFLLGRTLFREGGFQFEAAFAGALAFYGESFLAFLIPQDSLLGECLNVAVALISGSAIDKADLPPTPSGTLGEAAEVTTSTTTTSTTSTPQAQQPEQPPATPEPPTAEEPPEGQPEPGGIPPGVWIGILLVALGGGVAFLLFRRKSEECEELRKQLTEARQRASAAEAAADEARRDLTEAEAALAPHEEADQTEEGRDRPQHFQRLTEARQARDRAASALSEAEAELAARQALAEDAQYHYDVCMGFTEPRGAGVSEVPETPPSRPTTVVDAPLPPAVGAEPEPPPPPPPAPATSPPTKPEGDDPRDTQPPAPEKPEPCKENEVKDLEELGSLRGSLTLAYTISSGTEGIRSTEEEAAELVNDLNEVGDQISEINEAIQEGGSGAGALIADAAATVLELTARLGAGAAAAANQMLENHRVYQFTYEEHRVVVDMRWTKFLRCVNDTWQCFYDLEVKDFHEITIPQTESFEGNREARDRRMRVFIDKGENAVARDRPRFESFMAARTVGPC
jgi:hypothetical protein